MSLIDLRSKMLKNPDPKRVYKKRKISKISAIVLHCDDWDADVWTIAKYDVTPHPDHHISPAGCAGFTYHFFVEKDGSVLYCQDLTDVTWHAGNHNGYTVGICMRYKATGNKNPPLSIQLERTTSLMADLCLRLGIDPDLIRGHRELPGTGYKIVNGKKKLRKTCPGLLVNLDKIRYDVSIKVQKVLKKYGFYTGEIDGIFGKKSERALKRYVAKRKAG